MTYLPIRYETYRPQDCTDPRCIVCGRRMTVRRPERSDDPARFECRPCIKAEVEDRRNREAPVRKFEDNGRMLRWWIENRPEATAAQAWIRLMGLILETDEDTVEAARWKA